MNLQGTVDWSALAAPQAGLRCVVVLPARNEAALLPGALQAIAAQRDVSFPYEVIVLANNCSDDTAARARGFADTCTSCSVHVVDVAWPGALANVGRARRALLDVASQRVSSAATPPGIIVSTDADTSVADDWLAATAAAIDAGADAVGGRIDTALDNDLPVAVRRLVRLDDTYRTWRAWLESLVDPDPADPWPRHHQHFGASLAVTAHAYRAVGGQPLVPFLEDEALVRALRLEDKSVRHSPRVRVRTSARLDGRAEVGLSWQLREWSRRATEGGSPPVADPAIEAAHWAHRRRARALWREANSAQGPGFEHITELAEAMRIDRRWLTERVAAASPFGRLWDDIERQQLAASQPPRDTSLPMAEALRKLRRMVRAQRDDLAA